MVRDFLKQLCHMLFDRFYRFDESRARSVGNSGGSGLGLAIARQIVQAHRGSITANNHPETGGAWVRVHLPICYIGED
jgi:two-component system, OmpR family, phosphate regulon sensor histidine kinase PhoR